MTSDSKAVCGGGEADLLTFLDGLAENAAPDQRKPLNPILIGLGARALADRIRSAALASIAGAGDWQPIETAPRDGTRIDLWAHWPDLDISERVANARWSKDGEWEFSRRLALQYTYRPEILHWMPLPAGPGQSPAVPASPRSEELLSQGGGAGRSERAVEIRELSEKATEDACLDEFPHTASSSRHWMRAAMQFFRNEDYYRSLVVKTGECFGKPAHIADDGSDMGEVLCAKVPELVAALVAGSGRDLNAVAWAVTRWRAEVENRPLQNVHRRGLDTTWRQVIRHFGGVPEDLVGPSHDALIAAAPAQSPSTSDREG